MLSQSMQSMQLLLPQQVLADTFVSKVLEVLQSGEPPLWSQMLWMAAAPAIVVGIPLVIFFLAFLADLLDG
jgi:hypothetical protein